MAERTSLNNTFFKLSLIKSQFSMPLESILDKGLCFNYQKCIFELYKKVNTVNNILFTTLKKRCFVHLFTPSEMPSICIFLYFIKMCWCWPLSSQTVGSLLIPLANKASWENNLGIIPMDLTNSKILS